jgi:hypothetical protein
MTTTALSIDELATLLDLPPGARLTGVTVTDEGVVALDLVGVNVDGFEPAAVDGDSSVTVTSEVGFDGRRHFLRLLTARCEVCGRFLDPNDDESLQIAHGDDPDRVSFAHLDCRKAFEDDVPDGPGDSE